MHVCGYARLLLLKTFLCAKALTDADVCIVFIADFACVGSMNEIRLKNIVQARSNLLSLPWDACSVIFYPEKARGYSQFQFSPSEKHEAAADGVACSGNGDESDPDVLVDDTAVLPAVTVGTKRKKTYRELRALLSRDKADIDSILGRGDLGLWYPEYFSLKTQGNNASHREAREGFVLQSVQAPNDWLTARIARGSVATELPMPDRVVKVSRTEAKRARAENSVMTVPGQTKSSSYKYQKGERAEKIILEDLIAGVKKKMVVFVDAFLSVGDRAVAFLDIFSQRVRDATPQIFFYGVDPREHFFQWGSQEWCREAWLISRQSAWRYPLSPRCPTFPQHGPVKCLS